MFLIDLHVHTNLGGDSDIRPEELVACARRAGLDGICVTEHHSWDLSRPFDRIAEKEGFPIIRGLEYRAAEGHLLIYGVPAGRGDLPPGLPMQTAVDWVNRRGGAAVPAHPYQPTHSGTALGDAVLRLKGIAAIETHNGSIGAEENELACKAARSMGVNGIGGSDAHGTKAVGNACTCFPHPVISAKQLAKALKTRGYRPVACR